MNHFPLNEKMILLSLPEFGELTEQDYEKIHVVKLEYKDHLNIFSVDLFFEYLKDEDTRINLKFEMMGNRHDDHVFRHILYEGYTQELEFFSFKDALAFFNRLNDNT